MEDTVTSFKSPTFQGENPIFCQLMGNTNLLNLMLQN